MARAKPALTHCGGKWTKARYESFIKSAIRAMSGRWPVKFDALKASRVGLKTNPKTGRQAMHHKCACCGGEFPAKEVQVDHIDPIVPITGMDSWDNIIARALVEVEGMQVLCKPCHLKKTKEENDRRREYKKTGK